MFHHFTERKTCKMQNLFKPVSVFYRNQSLNYLTAGHYLELFPSSLICLGFSFALGKASMEKKHFPSGIARII